MTTNQSAVKLSSRLDAVVAARKAEMQSRMPRAARKMGEWAAAEGAEQVSAHVEAGRARIGAALGENGLAEAARAGRWSALWAAMESHKAEILRVLAGRE